MSADFELDSSQRVVGPSALAWFRNRDYGTIMFWAKPETQTLAQNGQPLTVGCPSITNPRATCQQRSGAAGWKGASRRLDADTAVTSTPGTSIAATPALQHLAVVFYWAAGTTVAVRHYENGVDVAHPSDAGWTANTSDTNSGGVGIGGVSTATSWDGRVADCRLYDRALSAAEIQTIYTCRGRDSILSGLAARWPCMYGIAGSTITTLVDISNGKKALSTVNGTPVFAEHIIPGARRRRAA